MTYLIALLSSGKGTWAYVAELINKEDWEKVFLVTNDFGRENFQKRVKLNKNIEFVVIDPELSIPELVSAILKGLEGRIADTEVALNIISGNGKEHTAVLSALLKLGLGVRFVALTPEGIIEP